MAETQGLRNMVEDLRSYSTGLSTKISNLSTKTDDVNTELDNITAAFKKQNGYVKAIYSRTGRRDTVSSTRHDTAGVKICAIHMLTSGCIADLVSTAEYVVNDTDFTSATTLDRNVKIWVKDVTKVVTSSHGAQIIYLNS